ncbi:hypothetical protein BEWA_033640 [Theileria equi strain WA]|uniref:RRM domain-containing protein n=1 Tax=Theileria equi strain WA TaxID=1537102 RepID=L0B056_THEEQ|nr:hypothetical protein BEWA_033640 [Theileria equi strain WA]AFZ80509.1 hypothetical protein BEWA_033640 [Theileria equi strain WA]|eukprot:XP_004830175.1 hypothetical protein BEWA_033640 [Theileria equi strain WA]
MAPRRSTRAKKADNLAVEENDETEVEAPLTEAPPEPPVDPYVVESKDPYDVQDSNEHVDVDLDEDTATILENDIPQVPDQEETNSGHVSQKMSENVELLCDMVKSLKQLEEDVAPDSDDSEEGAIVEDEVPFERLPDPGCQSNIVHLLNIPPEVDFSKIVSLISKYEEIVNHCFISGATELKIIFKSFFLASEAKTQLDNLKLHNRRIQAIYSKADEYNPKIPPAPHYDPNYNQRFFRSHDMPMIPPAPPVPPVPPIPPSLPLPPLPLANPPLPPTRGGHFRSFNDDRQAPNRIYFGRFISKMEGKTLSEIVNGQQPLSNWSSDQSVEEQQFEFDKIVEEYGITNRYLIVGGLPPEVTSSADAAYEWLSKLTDSVVDIDIVSMPNYEPNISNPYLHLTFQKRVDCQNLMTKITELGDGLLCKYAAPRRAIDSLWIGNIAEICGYCRNEEELSIFLSTFGDVRGFRLIPERLCVFVTYIHKVDAIRARNSLLGLSLSGNRSAALNVDFSTSEPRTQRSYRRSERDASSQSLGGKLLAAIQKRSDGDLLIKKLLSNDSDILPDLSNTRHHSRNSSRVDRFGRTIRDHSRHEYHRSHPYDRSHDRSHSSRHGHYDDDVQPWSRGRKRAGSFMRDDDVKHRRHASPPKEPVEDRVPEAPSSPSRQTLMCKLLKRGKPICNVSAVFVRGDASHKLPNMLDVNQRANPERLKNTLQKGPELSLWQLGADTRDDSVKYDGLCDYLISKSRVALVQEGPYEIYIVPPFKDYVDMLSMPDSQFMYAYMLPKGGN